MNYYVLAIGLLEQKGKRSMPISGRSLKQDDPTNDQIYELANKVALELLFRVLKLSNNNPLQVVDGDRSLLIVKTPLDTMQKEIPIIKNDWIENGNTNKFMSELSTICADIMYYEFDKYSGLKIVHIND